MGKAKSKDRQGQRVKPHELVQPWMNSPEFKAITKLAVDLHRSGSSAGEIEAAIAARFGALPEKSGLLDAPLPFRIYGDVGTDIEGSAVDQLKLAMRLPIAVAGCLLPDAHQGYALPIGGVFAAHRAISPAMVGVDIGCCMRVAILGDNHADCLRHRTPLLADLKAVTVFGIGQAPARSVDHEILADRCWQDSSFLRDLRPKAANQLGTSGAGNHFAEIVVGELLTPDRIEDPDIRAAYEHFARHCPRSFWGLLTHRGSRGSGYEIASHYMGIAAKETAKMAQVPRYYEWLDVDNEAGQAYWQAIELAGAYAAANHEIIHNAFARRINQKPLAMVQNLHNFAWRDGDTITHRKGATPAAKGVFGVIPGSMGTNSYVVLGLGNAASLNSASHGAGRRSSRTAARNNLTLSEVKKWLKDRDILVEGLSVDESPMACKDIERVMALQSELVLPVARMRPVAVLMAGERGDN